MTLMIPAVHLNGASRAELERGYSAALDALRAAADAVAETAPNGRDYYVYGRDAFTCAQYEHKARMSNVHVARDQVEVILMALMDEDAVDKDGRLMT